MKKIIITLVILLSIISLNAKDKKVLNVTSEAKNSILKMYPDAKNIKWSSEAKGYEAEFINNGTKMSVDIDKKGNISSTETTIKNSDLPMGVTDYIGKNWIGYKLTEAAKIVSNKGKITFEAEISKDKKSKDLIFDENGKILKK